MATNINNKIVCNEPHANLDSYYGPYNSVQDALQTLNSTTVNGVNYVKRHIGLTVGIETSEGIVEYWFKNGIEDNDLVIKSTESSMPQGVKIVTFTKNGATGGAQNSIMTDADGKIVLPECTLVKTGVEFSKWSYNNAQYSPGDVITIGTTTTVTAVWNAIPVHKVAWEKNIEGVVEIKAYVNDREIYNGYNVPEGYTVKLEANIQPGYKFVGWTGLSGSQTTDNPIEFVMGNSDVNIDVETTLYSAWCVCNDDEEEGLPVFTEDSELKQTEGSDFSIELEGGTPYKALYVITADGYTPRCYFSNYPETEVTMTPINMLDEDYNKVYDYYLIKNWVKDGSNETDGDLAQYGGLMFAIIDADGAGYISDTITIMVKKDQ